MDHRRNLPSVDKVLQLDEVHAFQQQYGYELTLQAAQSVLSDLRSTLVDGENQGWKQKGQDLPDLIRQKLEGWTAATLMPVINATGVILHTNLGRAPLSTAAVSALMETAENFSTLEFDLASGRRGSRSVHAAEMLKLLTGAEDALVVNNNAAAVFTGVERPREA